MSILRKVRKLWWGAGVVGAIGIGIWIRAAWDPESQKFSNQVAAERVKELVGPMAKWRPPIGGDTGGET